MNSLVRDDVAFPPILAFKEKSKSVQSGFDRTFDMTQAVPSFPTFFPIRARLAEAVLKNEVSFYTDVPGLSSLRHKIVKSHVFSETLNSDQVLITAGANHAMYLAMMLYFKAGDSVVLPEPFYFNYDMGLKMMGISPVLTPLKPENRFKLLADELIAAIGNKKIQGILLVTPNNPTGACYSSGEILKLLRWSSEQKIEVVIDETYMRYNDGNHLSDLKISRYIGKGLSLVGSFSKVYSLTGYRVGYLIAGLSEIQQALKVQDTSIICAPHISQLAAEFGLDFAEIELQQELTRIRGLSEMILSAAAKLKRFKIVSQGAFFAYLEHPLAGLGGEEATLELYKHTGILGLPGLIFGPNQSAFIRLAYCNLAENELKKALERLVEFDAAGQF